MIDQVDSHTVATRVGEEIERLVEGEADGVIERNFLFPTSKSLQRFVEFGLEIGFAG
jgi:hypothetical protein